MNVLPDLRDNEVLSALSAGRLVPVVVLDDAADADALAGALVAGGLPVAEVTFRTAAAADALARAAPAATKTPNTCVAVTRKLATPSRTRLAVRRPRHCHARPSRHRPVSASTRM